ncbi:MAG: DMT family transporter [Micavibrio sp.]|nr:DMT family transporter [Micavibrio sp.]
MSRQHRPVIGITLTVAAYFVMSLFSALNKSVQELGFPASQVMFFDGLVGALCMVVLSLLRRDLRGLQMKNVPMQTALMVINVSAGFLIFQAYPFLPLFSAYLIAFTGPLMITTLSSLVLKERIGWRQVVSILVGFAGVVIALLPQAGGQVVAPALNEQVPILLPMLKMLAGTTLFSIAQVMVRKMSDTESTWSFPFYFYIGMLAVSAALFRQDFIMPQAPREWTMVSMLGVLDAASLAMVYLGLKYAKASVVVPYQYSCMLWIVLLDFILWNKLPSLNAYIGGAILIAAGVYLAAFSRRRRHRRVRREIEK